MKKIISSLIFLSSLSISLVACSTPSVVQNQSIETWEGEGNDAARVLTITKVGDNSYTFLEKIQPKTGESFEAGGTMYYQGKDNNEAVMRFSKPGNSMVRAKYELSEDKNSFTYIISNSDTELAKQGQTFTYKKK